MKKISYLLLSGFFLIFFGMAWLAYQWYIPVQVGHGSRVSFSITPGAGVHQISAGLDSAGLIRSRWWWETYVWFRGWGKKFQIGEFRITPTMSGAKIAGVLTAHEGGTERTVTIIEGWTIQDIAQAVEVLKPPPADLEGYLFPDTYRISRYINDPLSQLVEKARANFDRKVTPELRAEIERGGHTLHEIITMASILEAEVQTAEDRALVSDIFWRRLKIGMALQADSTVNYVTGKNHAAVSLQDTKIDSPYNTYKYRGLPPGPINNPGLGAIQAATYPKTNSYWYFLTTKEGKVIYAKTFEEHVTNKRKWLR